MICPVSIHGTSALSLAPERLWSAARSVWRLSIVEIEAVHSSACLALNDVCCEQSVRRAEAQHNANDEPEIAVCIPPTSGRLMTGLRFLLTMRWMTARPLPREGHIANVIPTEYQT